MKPRRLGKPGRSPDMTQAPDCRRAIANGLAAGSKAVPERGVEGGRIYVSVDKAHAAGVKKAAKAAGLIFEGRSHYGSSNALYIGYDNCDGRALAKGTAMVAALKAEGIGCFRDEQED